MFSGSCAAGCSSQRRAKPVGNLSPRKEAMVGSPDRNSAHPAAGVIDIKWATCPALSAICLKCHKKGHYSAICFRKGPASAHELSVDTAFLGVMTTEKSASAWHTTISIGE